MKAKKKVDKPMSSIRMMVRGTYDLQKLRIQMGNRIVGNFKSKLGQQPSTKESEMGTEEKKLLTKIRLSYRKITDGVVDKLPSQKDFVGDELISSYTELCLVNQYVEMEAREADHFKQLEKEVARYRLYSEFLKGIKGCGAAMSGVIISEIDITKAQYASSLWKYAGLDVAQDGRGRGKYKEHLILQKYIDAEGKEQEKQGITFKPFLKTKLLGVLAGSFLKCKSPYSDHYYNYKNRLETDSRHQDKSKGHIHNMAQRYMIKRFLCDLYVAWRTIEGLEVNAEYHEAKHGHVHSKNK